MVESKENNSILKACGYCLKIFRTKDENKVGCNDCEVEIMVKKSERTLSNFLPKTLEERIKRLERKIEELER